MKPKEEKIEVKKSKRLWSGEYIALWSNGYIGVSDGVGFVGEEDDLEGLYLALKKFFKSYKAKNK